MNKKLLIALLLSGLSSVALDAHSYKQKCTHGQCTSSSCDVDGDDDQDDQDDEECPGCDEEDCHDCQG